MSQTYTAPPTQGLPQQPQPGIDIQQTYASSQVPPGYMQYTPQNVQLYNPQLNIQYHPPYNGPRMAPTGPPQRWENRYCGPCTPVDLCCKAYWCPCFVYGKSQHRLSKPNMDGYSPFNSHCFFYYLALHFGFAFVLETSQRGEIRAKHNLKGSTLGDCCRSYWCSWRELLQSEKELMFRTQSQQPLPLQQGYQTVTEGMSYTPKQ